MPPDPMPFADFLDLAGVPLEDGSMVTAQCARMAEMVRDYDPALEVEWIPREHRLDGDDPIRIVDTRQHGLARMVMSFASEQDFAEHALERLFLADSGRHDVLGEMEARNAAARADELKRYMDQKEEGLDLMKHALRGPSRYSYRRPDGTKVVLE